MTPRPSALGIEDVCTLFQNVGLHFDYTAAIRENAIDGSALLLLCEDDLRQEIGVVALGDRKKLANLISGLREIDQEQSSMSTSSISPNSSPIEKPLSTIVNSTPMSMSMSSAPSTPPSMFSTSPTPSASCLVGNPSKDAHLPKMIDENANANSLEDILGNTKMIDDFAKIVRGRLSRSNLSTESWLPFGKDKPYFSTIPEASEMPKENCFDTFHTVASEQSGDMEQQILWANGPSPTSDEEEHEEFWPSVEANANVVESVMMEATGKSWSSVVGAGVNTNAPTKAKACAPRASAVKKESKAEKKKNAETAKARQVTPPVKPQPQKKEGKKATKDENTTVPKVQQQKIDPVVQPQLQKGEQQGDKRDNTKKVTEAKKNESNGEVWKTVERARDAPKGAKGVRLPSQIHLTPPFVVWIGGIGVFDLPKQPSLSNASRVIKEELTKLCSSLGSLIEVAVVPSYRQPDTVGSAFVTYNSANGALRAISELQGKTLPGMRSCSLRVELPGNKWVRQCVRQYGQCC